MNVESPDFIDDSEKIKQYRFKVLFVGEPTVGKTSLVQRYSNGNFSPDYKSTIGVDFAQKEINWGSKTTISFQMWDLAGQERIGTQVKTYFRDAHGCVCLYDITNDQSKAQVANWKNLIDEQVYHNGMHEKIPCILVANKIDLLDVNEIVEKQEEILAMAKELGFIASVWISVKDHTNLEIITQIICKAMIKKYDEDIISGKITDAADDTIELMEFGNPSRLKRFGCGC